jgi:hypothetical protein
MAKSDAGTDVPSLTAPAAATAIVAVLLAAVPLLLIDPSENDSASVFAAIFGIPMFAVAVLIELLRRRVRSRSHLTRPVLLWMLVVMPAGILLLCVPPVLQRPEFFEATTVGGVFAVLGIMLFLIAIGILLGAVAWLFVALPLGLIVSNLVDLARGTGFSPARFIPPIGILIVTTIIIIGSMSIDGLRAGRAGWSQIVLSLFGIPAGYTVTWPTGLWIVRGLIILVIVAGCVPALATRAKRRASAADVAEAG